MWKEAVVAWRGWGIPWISSGQSMSRLSLQSSTSQIRVEVVTATPTVWWISSSAGRIRLFQSALSPTRNAWSARKFLTYPTSNRQVPNLNIVILKRLSVRFHHGGVHRQVISYQILFSTCDTRYRIYRALPPQGCLLTVLSLPNYQAVAANCVVFCICRKVQVDKSSLVALCFLSS